MRTEAPVYAERLFALLAALGMGYRASIAYSGCAKSKKGILASAEEGNK